MKSIATRMFLLAPDFESVLTADPSDTHGDDLRFAEFAQYLDALSQPDDYPLGGDAFTRQWTERELSVVYGVAAALLDVEVGTVRVEAGVDRALGTRHFRSSSGCLVVHDLYDRMFVELMRVISQIVIESDDREIASTASDVQAAITAAVVAVSFAHDTAPYVHAQLLANLQMVGFQSTLTRSRITFGKRNGNGTGIIPSVHMSLISDLIMALHELSHIHVRHAPRDERLVSMVAPFSVGILKLFSKMVPGTQEVISFLASKSKLKDPAVVAVAVESEVDSLALECLQRTGLYERIDARTTACVMFGVTLLEFCRKVGSILADNSAPHKAIVQAKALAVLRLSNAIVDILAGQEAEAEGTLEQELGFMRALLCYLLESTGLLESIFVNGLRGIVFSSLSTRINHLLDKYNPSEEMRNRHDGSVAIAEIEKWAADQLLHNWIDYSKHFRGTLRADRFRAGILGPERAGRKNEDTYLYLRDELSEV